MFIKRSLNCLDTKKNTDKLSVIKSSSRVPVETQKRRNPFMNNSQDNSFIYSTGRHYRLNVMRRYTFDKYTPSLPVVFSFFFFANGNLF